MQHVGLALYLLKEETTKVDDRGLFLCDWSLKNREAMFEKSQDLMEK